ncbi:MAG: PIG-L family deacetylase [Bacteroidota bacterium]|nr:PIG-L family deacetylase [Bacteroidota bacterium]MDE2834966.1 PIG-L family deacetylase [Bacteroidota bacterium]
MRSKSMVCRVLGVAAFALLVTGSAAAQEPLRIIAFGAHPDDCEVKSSGVAAMWAAMGHKVKYVSVTNGDIGHYDMAGGPLALTRKAEVEECGKILGIESSVVLDNHDGELMPTLENRKIIARLIRDWQADVVLTHRTNDYHPDHRYTAILVQDAAFMVTVPFFTPGTPRVEDNPVFLYFSDRFEKPSPFEPDIIVGIDDVGDQKYACMAALRSQFSDWNAWLGGYHDEVPKEEDARKAWIQDRFQARDANVANRHRDLLIEYYGEERGRAFKFAEAFEVSEYGSQPTREQLKQLFPFFDE